MWADHSKVLEELEGIFEPTPEFCKKHQFLALTFLCKSEEMILIRLITPGEDVTAYKGKSLESFSKVGPPDLAAMNCVIAEMLRHSQDLVPYKYDVKCWNKLTIWWTHISIHLSPSSFAPFLTCFLTQDGIMAGATLFSKRLTFTRSQNTS